MRLLARLWDDVARWHRDELPGEPCEGFVHEAAHKDVHGLVPHLALLSGIDPESVELTGGRPLAGAELDAPVGEEIEHGCTFGNSRRMIDLRNQSAIP